MAAHRQRQIQLIRKATFAFLILLLQNTSLAQLSESDTLKLNIRLVANGMRQTGNVDVGIFRSRAELLFRISESVVFKTQNNYLYQEFGRRTADNDLNSRNYLYYKPVNRFYPFAMAYFQTNYRLKIDYRYFAGAGATWQFLKKQNHLLKLSGSLVFEESIYRVNTFNEPVYSDSKVIALWRPTCYLAGFHRLLNDKLNIHYSAYWQPGISAVPNNRFQAEAGIDISVWKGLSLNAQYLLFYEQIVPVNVQQRDGLFTIGVVYQLKKKYS